jgi:hypothetical protein
MGALMTAVFGLVFWPYTSFRGVEYELVQRVADLESERAAAVLEEEAFEPRLTLFREEREDFEAFRFSLLRDLQAEEREHTGVLTSIRSALTSEPSAGAWLAGDAERPDLTPAVRQRLGGIPSDESCFWAAGESWLRCAIPAHLTTLDNHVEITYGRLPFELGELASPLRADLAAASARFRAWLSGETAYWLDGNPPPNRRLIDEFSRFTQHQLRRVTMHFDGLSDRRSEMRAEVSDLESLIASVGNELDETRERIAEIAALQDIETPFGPLPVGVNDLILIFPVLLAAGFFLTMSLAAEALVLRQSYFRLARMEAPDFFTEKYVAMIAPVWIDPFRSRAERAAHAVVLASPVLLYAVSIVLLMTNRLLWGPFMEEVRLGPWTYYAAYLVSALLFAEGGRRMFRQYSCAVGDR